MSDTTVTTQSPAPLPNDDAARSTTGEILDVRDTKPAKPATPDTSTTTTSTTEPTTPQTKPAIDVKPAATTTDTTKPPATTGAPEKYADFTAPDGYTLDSKLIESAVPILKELGLNQEQAQKLISFQAQQMIDAAKAPQTAYESMRQDWRNTTSNDAEIKSYATDGRTGTDAVKVDIGRALATLEPALANEFKAAMDLTGAGDHPAFVKAIWKLSQRVVEGKPVSGSGPSKFGQTAPGATDRPSAARSMYPNNP